MEVTRRTFIRAAAAAGLLQSEARSRIMKYVRYEYQGKISYGVLEGETVKEIRGGLFDSRSETGNQAALGSVRLLFPCEPAKVLAVGLNYRSHLGERPVPKNPEIFFKATTSLLAPGGNILIPPGAANVHFEGEFVVVIGKKARRVSAAEAEGCIFGFTCGNDVSERDWQKSDLQWWRAKGSDTFAPLGPAVVTGLDYKKSRLQTRVNGEVKQSQLLSDLIFDAPTVVSFVSQCVTLLPGDVIYTGTPGTTSAMKDGDTVEVEIDGIGILRNKVTK